MMYCKCIKDYYYWGKKLFEKDNMYPYYYESSGVITNNLSIWITYDQNGGTEHSGFRFYERFPMNDDNKFSNYFIDIKKERKHKLQKMNFL